MNPPGARIPRKFPSIFADIIQKKYFLVLKNLTSEGPSYLCQSRAIREGDLGDEKLKILRKEFEEDHYPDPKRYLQLAEKFKVTERKIRGWYQRERKKHGLMLSIKDRKILQAKNKKMKAKSIFCQSKK